jgi:Ca-activated chloride channel family protein
MEGSSLFLFARKEWFHLFWIVAIVLLSTIHYIRWRRKVLSTFGQENNVESLLASSSSRLRTAKRILIVLGLCFLVLSATGPMWGKKAVIVKSRGKDILFIIDISMSMLAEDVKPNRLERGKLELSRLLEKLSGNRQGLIIFSGDSFVLCPLTLDTGACTLLLDCIEAGNMPRPGTSLSGAIEKAIESFEAGENDYKAIVLISDGEDLEGEVDKSITRAKENGIKIFTLGIGTSGGVPIPVRDAGSELIEYKKDRDRETVITRLNEGLMKEIAEGTGGSFYRIGEGGSSVNTDYLAEEIIKMDEKVLAEEEVESYKERFQTPLFIAFLLLIVEATLGERRQKV